VCVADVARTVYTTRMRRIPLVIAALAFMLVPAPAYALRAPAHADGRDISYPQCGNAFPSVHSSRFGVLGVTGGRAFTKNPCLRAELRWAKRLPEPPAFYLNTGNPHPSRTNHWPIGQQEPRVCSATNPDSLNCSYDYGWNSARYAYILATHAAMTLHDVSLANAKRRAANVEWWLDVEILNSWRTLDHGDTRANQERDTASIAGTVNALWDLGVEVVGIYSTRYQWNLITGGASVTRDWFDANPVWYAGFDDHDHALEGCSKASFTGGPVLMTQYLAADGFDSNVRCA
jgi:hypothetical protein